VTWDMKFGGKVYDWFGRHPRSYRVVRWVSCLGREQFFHRRAIAALGLKSGDTVLDLACGTGFNHAQLARQVGPGGRVIALDYSAGMLVEARRRAQKGGWRQIEFVEADATQPVLNRGSLDAALCTFGLSAMPGETEAIRQVARALKPGALFVVFDAKPFTGLLRLLNPIVQPLFGYSTNWNYTKDVIAALQAAFVEIEVEEHNSGCNYIAVCRTSAARPSSATRSITRLRAARRASPSRCSLFSKEELNNVEG